MNDSSSAGAPLTKLDHALRHARRGLRVFPIWPESHTPLEDWPNAATTDEAQIRRWWTTSPGPNANIGICATDHLALDLDIKNGKQGDKSLRALVEMFGKLPRTYTQGTPSGGLHMLYRLPPGVQVRNSVGKLGNGLDVRGYHGYVVGAGSARDGKPYKAGEVETIAEAPQWLIGLCGSPVAPKERGDTQPATELDTEAAIRRVADYLKAEAPASIQGAGGDETAYRVACRARDLGVSEPTALDLMLEHWDERCQPPWGPEELAIKVANAYRYGENAPGSASPQADFTGVPLSSLPAVGSISAVPQSPAVLTWDDEDDAPEPEPLVDGLINQGEVVLAYGPPGAGKSFVAQKLVHCVGSGALFAGRTVERGAVLYVATEGHSGIRKRRKAMRKALGGRGLPIDFLPINVNLPKNAADRGLVRAAADALVARTGQPLRLIVFDTLSASAPGMDENSAGEVSAALQAIRLIASGTGAAVFIVHHEGKNGANGPRGSSAFTGNVDVQMHITEGTIESDKERENAPMSPIRFDLQVVEVGRTRSGKVVTSCVARVYSPAESAFQVGMTEPEKRAFDVLVDLCLKAGTDEELLGWVRVGAWRDSSRDMTTRSGHAERQRWKRLRDSLRDKGWIKENDRNQVLAVERDTRDRGVTCVL